MEIPARTFVHTFSKHNYRIAIKMWFNEEMKVASRWWPKEPTSAERAELNDELIQFVDKSGDVYIQDLNMEQLAAVAFWSIKRMAAKK